ncbi:hypothetical protein K1719_017952 [Acacia pycnantha]|nr:hypothetical protein K1719_017952 [Acacia pycnantha]
MYASYHNTYRRKQASHSTNWRKRAGITKLRNSIKTKIRNLPGGTLQKVSTITTVLERELFSQAASEEEYKNPETIMKVLQNNLRGIICSPQVNKNNTNTPMKNPSSSLSHAFCNQNQAGQASPMFAASNINFTVEMDWVGYNGNQSLDFLCKPRESPLSIHGAAYGLESANNTMDWVNYNGNQVSATKRFKIEPTAPVSNNDIYEIWDSHMVLTNSPERLPKLHQQEEPSFPIFPQVTENHMESSANAMQDSVSFSNANNAIGIEAILFECRDKYNLRDSYPKSNDEEQDKNGIESIAKSIADKTNKGGTIFEGIEAGNILEDSYLNNGDVKLTDNNLQTDVDGSNSSDHTLQKDPIVDKDDVE